MLNQPNVIITIASFINIFGVALIFFSLINDLEKNKALGKAQTYFFARVSLVQIPSIVLIVLAFIQLEKINEITVSPVLTLSVMIAFWILGILLSFAKFNTTKNKEKKSLYKTRLFMTVALVSNVPIIGVVTHINLFLNF